MDTAVDRKARVPRFLGTTNATVRASLPALIVCLTVALLGRDHGGWYPTAWDWAAIGLLFISASALMVLRRLDLQRTDVLLLIGFVALTAWTGLSWAWSESPPESELELERAVMYLAGVLALLLVARRRSLASGLVGLLVGDLAICCHALSTRLFPDRVQIAGISTNSRLEGLLAYPNALGILAVIGILLALAFVVDGSRWSACAAAAALPLLAATLLFTFSRGAWASLLAGGGAIVLLMPGRRRLLALVPLLLVGIALPVWLSSRSETLTRWSDPLAAAGDGHRLAAALVALAAASALTTYLASVVASSGYRRPLSAARTACLAGALAGVVFACVIGPSGGAPPAAAHAHGTAGALPARSSGATSETAASVPNPTARLFTTAGDNRLGYWRVALDDFLRHPLNGSGAGTFGTEWLQHRRVDEVVQDAHSLYLETAAELGLVGLLILAATLALPLVAAIHSRARPLVAGVFGAYVAALVHAGVDWDWELPGVMFAGLFCGVLLVVAAREPGRSPSPLANRWRTAGVTAVLAVTAFAFVGLVGNRAYAIALRESWQSSWPTAQTEAARSARWAPWAAEPLVIEADAASFRGDRPAVVSFLQQAVGKDPHNADLWRRLASVTQGTERTQALAEAQRLDPRG